jgi:hypothetical protein
LRFKNINTGTQHSFKKRYMRRKVFLKNTMFNSCLYNLKYMSFEYCYFKFIKVVFKKFFKLKYVILKKFFFFFFLNVNFPVSLKVKNSRMGKGVGYLQRWVFRLKRFTVLFSFNLNNLILLKNIIKIFKLRLSKDIHIKNFL